MKWYCQNYLTPEKSKLTVNDGPFHRFYRHRPAKQPHTRLENRLQLVTTQLAENQEGRLRQLFQNHRHKFDWRQQQKQEHFSLQNGPEEAPPEVSSENSKMRSSIRVAWVQQNLHQLPKALSLRTRFVEAGMEVNIHQWAIDDVIPLECELIVLDCCPLVEQEMMKFLLKIRFFTQAPLIVLTDSHSLDGTISALRGGADAIFTVNMPDDVIVARSNALLRRWIPS